MRISTTILTFTGLVSHIASAAYTLQDDYSTANFFSMFDFFTADDPTHGYVNYVDQGSATSAGLAGIKGGQVYMGVDTSSVATGRGRNSVRITSKKSYNVGSLIILDLNHMPGSVCGTWPAFWTVGPNWPNSGEIDIIEGVNSQTYNHYALHTSSGCSISNTGLFSGSIETPNCDVNAAGQPNNAGCSIVTSDTTSYGDGFNAQQGGVYATEFTSSSISIWFFPRSGIPSDVTSGNPNPSTWGTPHANFGSPCNIGSFVKQQQIVFDTTFCGDWAGSVWSTDATCSSKASSCQDFVQNNPSAFKESYWSINSLQVYSGSSSGGVQPSANGTSARPSVSGGAGVPTSAGGLPSSVPISIPGGQQSQSFGAGVPQQSPGAQPQQASWGGNGGRFTVSAWNGGGFGQVADTNTAEAPSATAGQFYNAGSGVMGAAASASTTTASAAAAVTGNSQPGGGAPAGSTAYPGAAVPTESGSDLDYGTDAGGTTDANANTNNAVDTSEDTTSPQAAPQAAPQPQPSPQSQPPAAQGNQYQDVRTALPFAGPSGIPTAAITTNPTKTCGSPLARSSWSGRYVTVTALGSEHFDKAKREMETEMGVEDEMLRRRSEKEERGLIERTERTENLKREEVEGLGLRGHQHRHIGGGGLKRRGWWRS